MKKRFFACIFLAVSTLTQAQLVQKDLAYFMNKCPFPFSVKEPIFKAANYYVKDFGAIADGKTINTAAIAKAITTCNSNGGGKVIFTAGKWITGPIELLSNVNIVVEKDALIQFSENHTLYPIIKAGKNSNTLTPASPIYAYEATNIAITGEGTIDGAGDSWRPVKKNKVSDVVWNKLLASGGIVSSDGKIWWPSVDAMNGEDYLKNIKGKSTKPEDYLPARDFLRPYMVFFVGCSNILLDGVRIQNSPKFIFYPSRCNNLTIKNANFYNDWWAQNGDGIDISACKNVAIYNTTVSVGDDAICMKSSGTNSNADDANLENVLIANCTVYRGHGAFVIGSNTDGGMKNIFVTNCMFNGTDIGVRVKSNSGRGGRVQQIYVDSISMFNIINEAILFDTYYEDVVAGKDKKDVQTTVKDKVPEFMNFTISNVSCKKAKMGIYMNGLEYMPVHDIQFKNLVLQTDRTMELNYAKNITGTNIVFETKKTNHKIDHTDKIVFNGELLK